MENKFFDILEELMEPLAKPAIAVVKEGRVKFVPERFSKTYLHWMENIREIGKTVRPNLYMALEISLVSCAL